MKRSTSHRKAWAFGILIGSLAILLIGIITAGKRQTPSTQSEENQAHRAQPNGGTTSPDATKSDRSIPEKRALPLSYYVDRVNDPAGGDYESILTEATKTLDPPELINELLMLMLTSHRDGPRPAFSPPELTPKEIVAFGERYATPEGKVEYYSRAIGFSSVDMLLLRELLEEMPPSRIRIRGFVRYYSELSQKQETLNYAIEEAAKLSNKEEAEAALQGIQYALFLRTDHHPDDREGLIQLVSAANTSEEIRQALLRKLKKEPTW